MRWLVSISISVASPDFSTATFLTCALPEPTGQRETVIPATASGAGAGTRAAVVVFTETGRMAVGGAAVAGRTDKVGSGVGADGGSGVAAGSADGLAATIVLPSPSFTMTDLLAGKSWNGSGAVRSTTTRVTGGLMVTRPMRTPLTAPLFTVRARSSGPGTASEKSMIRRSGSVTTWVSGMTRWLVWISICRPSPDFTTATWRICAFCAVLAGVRERKKPATRREIQTTLGRRFIA